VLQDRPALAALGPRGQEGASYLRAGLGWHGTRPLPCAELRRRQLRCRIPGARPRPACAGSCLRRWRHVAFSAPSVLSRCRERACVPAWRRRARARDGQCGSRLGRVVRARTRRAACNTGRGRVAAKSARTVAPDRPASRNQLHVELWFLVPGTRDARTRHASGTLERTSRAPCLTLRLRPVICGTPADT
jgi:hypothetical protein